MAKPSVILIPWDPHSQQHIDRMVEQRKNCGWHAQRVPVQWRDAHIAGSKCIYWIAFAQDEPERERYNKQHADTYSNETEHLVDTSETLLGKPCTPSGASFFPVGHIALETHDPAATKKLGIVVPDEGSYWIKSLYVSYILQGLGVGGSAMRITEQMLTEEPHRARHLLLDTVHQEDQQDKEFALATYGELFKIPTQPWYERQGYRLIATISEYYTDPLPDGTYMPCRTVFLQKDLI